MHLSTAVLVSIAVLLYSEVCSPSFISVLKQIIVSGAYSLNICVENCAQCKKWYGKYFDGQKCANTCVETNNRLYMDCDDKDVVALFTVRPQ